MRPSIVNLARGIEREIAFVRQKEHRHASGRYAEAMQDIDQVLKCYRRIQTLLERLAGPKLNANVNIWMLVDEQATHYRLDKLSPSYAAWYSSAESKELYRDECTPDTRVEVLERLQVWREDDASEKIYWLNGMAGTGKTTLSYTLCKQLEAENRLAANFFVHGKFRAVATSNILEQNPDVHTRRLSEQFARLLLDPLREVQHSLPPSLVVVIEALDECTNDHGVGEILDVLFAHVSDLPVKFFLTSRSDPIIRNRMLRRNGDRKRFELHLHELDKSIVGDDIRRYLQAGLKRANPSVGDLEILTERSGVLFIYAATVVRYIGAYDFSRSADRLESVLRASTASNSSDKEINALYNLILMEAFDDLVWTIERKTRCGSYFIQFFQSNEGITTLHKSFPDYMLDAGRSRAFYCDVERHNAILAQRCFELMKIPQPSFNICGLESSYVLDEEVPDLPKRREQAISGELAYACRYWSAHLELAGAGQNFFDELHSFLSVRLLLWMEIMNIMQGLQPGGIKMLSVVKESVKVGKLCDHPGQLILTSLEHRGYTTETRELAEDAYEFVNAFSSSPASQSTPHIYISALPFWPKERPVSKCYSYNIRSPIEPMRPVIQRPGSVPLTIYGIGSDVRCVAFSQDGAYIVAGSGDMTLRVWEASTGQVLGTPLRGHADVINSVAYSPNSKHIVSGSDDRTIRIWDTDEIGLTTSEPLKGHTSGVCSVAYSHSGVHIVSGSNDRTIRIWNAQTGKLALQPLQGHAYGVCSVAYSTDDTRIVSGSSDRTIRIWDASTGQLIGRPLEGHTRDINSVAYSPDSTRIISGASDRTIRIWDAHTGNMIGNPLEGHAGSINSVACSPDGARIVSGSSDRSVRIWDLRTGHVIGKSLKGHNGGNSLRFSPGA
ncbi:hypothetical protein FRC10_010230 [Ceratobasidium sp. 414]|nr:hypothetical protein FRC10_010230 [Ceratobasidium sp. 414]